ncbi:MAG: hypothetical protein K2M65_05805 [Muribaculaceae bacterium]|nr:hypothetical protein [Muribaculaceae bacterium]
MSKTQLKKELQALDKDGIIQVVLDLYSARKEAKDYLEFFIDPDINARCEKSRQAIAKELARGRRDSRARISQIRKIIKDIATLQPDAEYVADLMVYAIETAFATSRELRFRTTLINGMERLIHDTVDYLDSHELLAHFLPRLEAAAARLSRWSSMKSFLPEAIEHLARN